MTDLFIVIMKLFKFMNLFRRTFSINNLSVKILKPILFNIEIDFLFNSNSFNFDKLGCVKNCWNVLFYDSNVFWKAWSREAHENINWFQIQIIRLGYLIDVEHIFKLPKWVLADLVEWNAFTTKSIFNIISCVKF